MSEDVQAPLQIWAVYLILVVWNRPFDDQTQARIRAN